MPETTRRGFVKGSAASLVAMGFASSVSADKSPPSPNDKIQVGMVGAAGRAGSLLRMFAAREDVEIVGIADIDQGRLASGVAHVEKVKGRRPAGHGDFRRLTDNQQIDVIVVGTPDHWHAIPTIMACQAGKDVYVEKPDGHNMVEGQRMVQAMRKHKRIVQLGTQARSTPAHRESMQYVRSGRLGRVLVAKAWESAKQGPIGHPSDSQPPPGVDYDMWLGPAPQRPFNVRRFHGSWRWFFDYGTGDLGNDGVHRIDVARWALATAVEAETGKTMSALPRKVSAIGGKWYFDDIQEWPDTLQVNYEYSVEGAAGRILTYEMRIWAPYPILGLPEGSALFGDQGYIVMGHDRWSAHAPDGERLAGGRADNGGAEHVANFLDCVRTRQRAAADLDTVGHPSSVMCHAGNIAWRTGEQLTLDPETELFDKTAANDLRTRPVYRKPWELPVV